MDLTMPAVPFFLALIAVEILVTAVARTPVDRGYAWRDTLTSLGMGVGSVGVGVLMKGGVWALYQGVWHFRLLDLGHAPVVFALALVLDDFAYYWFHRLSHEVRLLWAAHVNHHSSRHYNLSTALRQPWTTFLAPFFYLPLPLLGIDPLIVITVHSANLLYQFWIHTEHIGRLGPLEALLNTPSHHRVHHGRNVRYLDRNYAGIFILWDRLFGSFEPESEPVDYGITHNLDSQNLLWVAFHEWVALARDLRHARGWREVLGTLLGPPGWSADGHTQTARQLRRALSPAQAGAPALR